MDIELRVEDLRRTCDFHTFSGHIGYEMKPIECAVAVGEAGFNI